MNVSYKNKLQEFCQKMKLDLPGYLTEHLLDGTFQCTVKIDYNGRSYTASGNDRKKIMSEQKAAEALCMILQSYIKNGDINIQQHNSFHQQNQNQESHSLYITGKRVYVFVDLENITNGLEEMFKSYQFIPAHYITFFGFLSHGHHNSKKRYSFSSFGTTHTFGIFKVDSTRRDACDVALIMKITEMILSLQSPDLVIVASGDKFAPALVDAINTNFLGIQRRIVAIHANNADEIGYRLLSFQSPPQLQENCAPGSFLH